jgi:SNF2 family DNA or RNA helicase
MSYALYSHQKEMLRLATENDRFLFLAEVGTGKTLPMLIHMSNLLLSGEIDSALVVAPLSGLGAWKRDIEKLSPDRQRLIRGALTLVNYDKLSRKTSKWRETCWKSWGMVVLDEGHAIKKPTSNRTQYFVGKGHALGLASKAQYRYLLTGTLITNSHLEDLWAPLRFLFDDAWMTWADFKRHYLVTKTLPGSYAEIVVGYRNRAELLEWVAQCSYRILKKDCLDLPEQLPDEVVLVPWATGKNAEPFNKSTKELYADALESYVEALDLVSDNPLTRLLHMRQIAAGHIKEQDTRDEQGKKHRGRTYRLNNDKVRYAMELVENNSPHKTVIFYQFRETCVALEDALKKTGRTYVTLNGDQPDKEIWRRFQDDDAISVIVVQYQSGSSAIDLFAASYTIFMEPTDSSFVNEQAHGRTHRSGQKQACNYVFLLTEGSVEEDMYRKLDSHEDFSETQYRDIARMQMRGK